MASKTKDTSPSVEKAFKTFFDSFPRYGTWLAEDWEKEIMQIAKRFAKKTAKHEVSKALEAASKKAKLKDVKVPYEGVRAGGHYVVKRIDEKSILNAYKVK
jgi:hypothetical protein